MEGGQTPGMDMREKASDVSTQIRILGGPDNTSSLSFPQLDLIDGDENEVFTLELFRKLILESRRAEKDFVIARVTTSDPEDSNVLYNYYYSAFEMNKILFKYESSRKLLHRMKVKNPLNNMNIIGQVSYYKITTQEFDRAVVAHFFENGESSKRYARRAFSTIIRNLSHFADGGTVEDSRSKDTNDIRGLPSYGQIYGSKDPSEIVEGVKQGEIAAPTQDPGDKKVVYDARYFASDDDFLLRAEIREYFRRNTTDPEDDYLFELERGNNDIFALLETTSEGNNEDLSGWKRILTGHMSILMCMLCVIILFGAYPLILFIALGLVLAIFFSLVVNMCYVMCCRRAAFDTLDVRSIDEL